MCVFVNFHLWPQVTNNCKYVELSIWTPKRVKKFEITDGFPLCLRTTLVERSMKVLNEQGEPAASYR